MERGGRLFLAEAMKVVVVWGRDDELGLGSQVCREQVGGFEDSLLLLVWKEVFCSCDSQWKLKT